MTVAGAGAPRGTATTTGGEGSGFSRPGLCGKCFSFPLICVLRWCGYAGVVMTTSEVEAEVGMTMTGTKEGILIVLKVRTSPSGEVRFC
jgi:hypothetical protein